MIHNWKESGPHYLNWQFLCLSLSLLVFFEHPTYQQILDLHFHVKIFQQCSTFGCLYQWWYYLIINVLINNYFTGSCLNHVRNFKSNSRVYCFNQISWSIYLEFASLTYWNMYVSWYIRFVYIPYFHPKYILNCVYCSSLYQAH